MVERVVGGEGDVENWMCYVIVMNDLIDDIVYYVVWEGEFYVVGCFGCGINCGVDVDELFRRI